jgi:hypothetical protein
VIHFVRSLAILFVLVQGLSSCGLFDDPTTSSVSCDSDCNVTITEKPEPQPTTVEVGGKLAQSYVRGAYVWADKLVDGEGDLQWENGEPLVLSGENGDYQLPGITGEFRLVTSGGKKQDSAGGWTIGASPMVAPAPELGQATTNVTPLTTLVAFEPALKEKLAAYGDWKADIASPSGVSGNLLRIAKTVETFSSALSGGDSPLVSDPRANLKSLGKLATSLNSVSGDLASEAVLKASASSALTTVVSDPTLVPNPPADVQALVRSLEQAVEGITAAIPATDEEVLEDANLLAQIEEVLENASIAEGVSLNINLGGGGTLNFGAVLTEIEMYWIGNSLILTAVVPDDDPTSLDYNWSTTSPSFSITDPNQPVARVIDFDGTDLEVRLSIIDTAANNFTTTGSCVWKENPTTCKIQ